MKTIQIPAIIDGLSALKDNTMSVRIHTQELSLADKALLLEYHGKYGYFLFKENSFKEEEIPKEDAKNRDFKRPSQRLRAVLFVCHQKLTDKTITFDAFYEREMEKIIENYKGFLV